MANNSPAEPQDQEMHHASDTVHRRRVIAVGGAVAAVAGLGLAATASATPESRAAAAARPTRSASATATATASSSVCSLTAEVTEGPYALEGALVRTDITEGKSGVPVEYTFTVVDEANSCAPLEGALVEIWHADTLGEYSGFVGRNGHSEDDDGTFLRGGQITDSNGQASITSIWPGHYISRAVHVHLRVHTDVTLTDDSYTGGEIIHTGQLFFDATINTQVQQLSPYSSNTTKETSLDDDTVYDGGGASSGLLTLTALGSSVSDGYAATLTIGVSAD
ncbi:intradiol ring-cleavage dioxygenase [Streptomyces sp. NBC_00564]|uniref:intradiol ring-cleavage dioxygenase n=1 Tax=Streptomyces sp. NBC_00564 TaxID=2903663 RepID=UPI00352CD419|nr:intradiol ring-cleavage dioxygenase [Streptomyces sp. NBC_00564]